MANIFDSFLLYFYQLMLANVKLEIKGIWGLHFEAAHFIGLVGRSEKQGDMRITFWSCTLHWTSWQIWKTPLITFGKPYLGTRWFAVVLGSHFQPCSLFLHYLHRVFLLIYDYCYLFSYRLDSQSSFQVKST